MAAAALVLRHGGQTATFVRSAAGYRPEWFRLGRRPMLRFKDHEFLNVGALRITHGQVLAKEPDRLSFGGQVELARVQVRWSVTVAKPADGRPGFLVTTRLQPLQEPIEVLEALTAFELPYEYDGREHMMTAMSQQPIFRFEGDKQLNGAGYIHPFWYYGRPGRAHLTFPSNSPLMACRVHDADGANERCTMLIGNWTVCSVHDMFAQPTRALRAGPADNPFPDPRLKVAPGRRGRKFLIGAVNWNTSLQKDPNVLVTVEAGLGQEVLVDYAGALPKRRWDVWLAGGWERMARLHFPADGHVPAWEIACNRGASWVGAAEWLSAQFAKPAGCPGFFYPHGGPCVYAPHTRPTWDPQGVPAFAGQWIGPLAYLAHVWKDRAVAGAIPRLEKMFLRDKDHHRPEQVWTIGPTPWY